MKRFLNFSIVGLGIIISGSCSLGVSEGSKTLEEIDGVEMSKEIVKQEPVEISFDKIVGTWKYAEVRTSPNETGTAPMGEILLGITKDYTLAFATEGITELKDNLEDVPSLFEIKNNMLHAVDMSSEIDFKLNFKNTEVKCYLLNENEMVLGKESNSTPMPIYMYYTRVD